MDSDELVELAYRQKLFVSVTVDPDAEPGERWIAAVGLDAIAAGATVGDAISAALAPALADDDPEPLPFTDWPHDPIDDDQADALDELPVLARRAQQRSGTDLPSITR